MAHHLPALSISQIIACDAPLLSPVAMSDNVWDQPEHAAPFNYSYYPLQSAPPQLSPPSTDTPPAARMLKMRLGSESIKDDPEPLCVPTHQLFDLSDPAKLREGTAPLGEDAQGLQLSQSFDSMSSACSTASKRSASPALGNAKKRAANERVSSKDFVPPDVSGLSKREARLVKNRAAAFLSRQRKREEFENMEVRVAELEQENARLLALSKSGSQPPADSGLASEVELLRAQLAAAQKRERELSEKLSTIPAPAPEPVAVKVESTESYIPISSSRSSPSSGPNKTAASFGLMVLLCALPTLLSMPMQSASRFSVASPFPSSAVSNYNNYKSNSIPGDFEWSRSPMMDTGADEDTTALALKAARKLEFAGVDTNELGDLGGLDISFDTSSTDNGKIRVRIHPSSPASSRAASPGLSSQASSPGSPSPMESWSEARSSFSPESNSPLLSSASADPFLGIDYNTPFNDMDDGSLSDFGLGSEYSVPDSTGGKRRVRIALKTPPCSTTEGGEWEVQIC